MKTYGCPAHVYPIGNRPLSHPLNLIKNDRKSLKSESGRVHSPDDRWSREILKWNSTSKLFLIATLSGKHVRFWWNYMIGCLQPTHESDDSRGLFLSSVPRDEQKIVFVVVSRDGNGLSLADGLCMSGRLMCLDSMQYRCVVVADYATTVRNSLVIVSK